MPRVAVLISGTGTLLQSLIDDPHRGYEIAVVGADRPAAGLQRATDAGIPTLVVRPAGRRATRTRRAYVRVRIPVRARSRRVVVAATDMARNRTVRTITVPGGP